MRQKLTLWPSVSIVAGSMIGSGIFIVSSDMARVLGSPLLLLVAWVITGAMALMAALSYGEMAGMFPQTGGPYQYLKHTYGDLTAFLFGWSQFTVIQSGAAAAVAVAFAKFTGVLVPFFRPDNVLLDVGWVSISASQLLAVASLAALTWLNTRGLSAGVLVQNLLTVVKILSFGGLILLGCLVCANADVIAANWQMATADHPVDRLGGWLPLASAIGVAMVGSLFSSDAWNNLTYMAGEVEEPRKTIPKALTIGVGLVTVIYLLSNVAYLCVLPLAGMAEGATVLERGIAHAAEDRVGTAALTAMLGAVGSMVMAILIMISTTGCNAGILPAGARVYETMAEDGLFFSFMKHLNRNGVPAKALWVQFAWCALLCLSGKYGDLLDYVMFVVIFFYIITVFGVIWLRIRRPDIPRPIKAVGYPLVPILYILLAGFFVGNLIYSKPQFTIPGLFIVGLGVPVYFLWRQKGRPMNG